MCWPASAFAAGTRVHTLKAATGSLAERFLIDEADSWQLPDGDDDVVAASLGIAGLAGWVAVEERARLQPGERVLVLGATGTVGLVAVQAARLLGAGRIVAAGRDGDRLRAGARAGRRCGSCTWARSTIWSAAFREAFADDGPEVVIDPLWGAPALAAMRTAPMNARIVNLGQSAGAEADAGVGHRARQAAPDHRPHACSRCRSSSSPRRTARCSATPATVRWWWTSRRSRSTAWRRPGSDRSRGRTRSS